MKRLNAQHGLVVFSLSVLLAVLTYAPQAVSAAEVVKLGATLAVTGPFSAEAGPSMLKFMEAWEQVVNEEGGVTLRESGQKLQLDLIVYDDESKPEKSVELYEKLANVDQVHTFIGPFSSPITKAVSAVAERLQIPMVACEANDTSLFTRGFQWFTSVLELGRPWSRTYFEMIADANKQGTTSYRTVAIVSSDTPHTRDVGRGAVDFAKTAGLQVIAEKQVPFRTTDFSGVIPGLKAVEPRHCLSGPVAARDVCLCQAGGGVGLAAERAILPLSWRGVWAGSGRAAGRGRGGGKLQRPEVVCWEAR